MTETARCIRYPIDGRAQRILAAAFTEFSRRGVRAARTSVIARRAGVSLATLRQYFPTTDELFREVIRTTIVRLILQPQEPGTPTPGEPTIDRIRGFMRQFWRAMEEPDQAAMLRLSLSELSGYPELALFHATEVIGRAVGRLEAVLSEGARRGEIHPVDVRTAARVILATLITYTVWFASPDIYGDLTGPDRRRMEEAVIDLLVGVAGGATA
jgi:TetR/AcrR family transcriptional regulator of autoinduction and epiphytic fitness